MHRDPTLRKRNALVIPGVLLAVVCLAGIMYAQGFRSDDVECGDGKMVVFAGACRSATLLLVIPLALGALLVVLGSRLRGHNTCHLGHGTVATTGLALLTTAFALSAIAALALNSMQDPDDPYIVTIGEIDYTQARLLGGLAFVFFVALVPYALLYAGTARPRRCCRDKGCFEPCFCDEDTLPPVPTFPTLATTSTTTTVADLTPMPPPGETAQVTTTAWGGPPAREVQPLPPPPPRAAPAKAPAAPPAKDEAKPLVHDAWPQSAVRHDANLPGPGAATPPAAPETASDDPALKRPAKKAPAKKTRKVTRRSK